MKTNNGTNSQAINKQEQANPFRGLYRTISWAYVTNDVMAFQVPEAEYRAFGYEPDYDKLPWKEEYDAARAWRGRYSGEAHTAYPLQTSGTLTATPRFKSASES
jgi:hypothetical protein